MEVDKILNNRFAKLKKQLALNSIDCAIFIKDDKIADKSIYYFCDVKVSSGILVCFKTHTPILFISPLDKMIKSKVYETRKLSKNSFSEIASILLRIVLKESPKNKINKLTKKNIEKQFKKTLNISFDESLMPKKMIADISKKIITSFKELHSPLNTKSISKHKHKLNLQTNFKFNFSKDISNIVSKQRISKDELEYMRIKKAIKITETIFKKLYLEFSKKRFKKEIDVINFLKIETIKNNCELAFDPIVASGKNSSNPHYFPTPIPKLKKGFCVIDFGVSFEGYCADITRTIYLGIPNKKNLDFYNNVLNSVFWIEKNFNINKTIKENFSNFEEHNFKMPHSLGHGIGLDIHENPFFANNPLFFENNTFLAIEPGQYFSEKGGIRIEDDYYISKKSLKRISVLDRQLKVFDIYSISE